MTETRSLPNDAEILEPGEVRPLYVARSKVDRVFVGLAPQTLANLAHEGFGPSYFRRGKQCWYSVATIERWLTERPVKTNEGS